MTSSVECRLSSRKLGHQELLFYSLNQLKSPIGTYINTNIIESKRELQLDEVKKAFQKASETNYLLRARVNTSDNETPYFELINDVRLKREWMSVEETAPLESEEDWAQVLPKILERKIDFLNGPLWYAKWMRISRSSGGDSEAYTYILLMVFSHIIADAKTGFNLIYNQILPYLNQKTPANKPIFFADPLESAVYNFNGDQLALSNRSVPLLFRAVANAFVMKQKIGKSLARLLTSSNNATKDTGYINQFTPVTIDRQISSGFVRLCKQKKVTVHSLLMVVVHNALFLAKRNYEIELNTDVLLYPIDTRKFNSELNSPCVMPLGDYHKMGQQAMTFASVEKERDFTGMAKETNVGIKEHNKPVQENTLFDCCFHLLQKNNLSLDTFNALPPPCVFSNLGNCDVIFKDGNDNTDTRSDDVVLKKHFFTLQTCSGVFVATCTYGGRMCFVVSNGESLSDGPSKFVGNVIKSNIEYLVKVYLDEYE